MSHENTPEDALIRIIQRTIKSRGRVRLGIGDDAAVLQDGTVITTDAYAAGVHFDLSYMTLRQVGERCACGAISDVVAMAAEPEAVLVALALPRDALRSTLHAGRSEFRTSGIKRQASGMEQVVVALYRGIESVCAEMGCEVAGGDIIVADQLLLALTVTGRTRRPKLRSGARPGDRLYVTGHLGSAEAGRMILADEFRIQKSETRSHNRRGEQRKANGDWRLPLVRRHLRPVPRLVVMRELKARIHALIDTSDGLATDARHLSEMSGVRIVLEADAVSILPATRRFCAGRGFDPLGFVLGAGEDFELLFTSACRIPSNVRGVKVTPIGSVQKGSGLWISRAGRTLPVTVSGYDHLRADGTTC